jgi:regulator of sirC expression with transglutaminase-like and TPR domain
MLVQANLDMGARGGNTVTSSMDVPMSSTRTRLREALGRSARDLELGRAALYIAQEEYPQLPVERYTLRLDALAEAVKDRLDDETAPPVVLGEVIHALFEREGLRGNKESYHDPRNSFINDVLDRRLGIPLTLGIILLEVGWRLGLPLEGVNFPGHFLVRYRGAAEHLLIDPFDAGRIRFESQAQEVLDQQYGGVVRMQPAFLRAASKLDMIRRLLVNLKGLYVNVKDDERALSVVECLMLLHPAFPGERRDRGMLLLRLGREQEAKEQLRRYLDGAPGAVDAKRIGLLVRRLDSGLTAQEEDLDG